MKIFKVIAISTIANGFKLPKGSEDVITNYGNIMTNSANEITNSENEMTITTTSPDTTAIGTIIRSVDYCMLGLLVCWDLVSGLLV